jgi:hypothetical protein
MSDASDAMSTEDSPVKEQQNERNDDDSHDEKEQVESEADDDKHSDNNNDDNNKAEWGGEEKNDDQEDQVKAEDIKDDQEDIKDDQEETKPGETCDDHIVKSIYDHMITSICIDVACNMHELIKKGEFSMSELREPFSRREVYPELYKDQDDAAIQETLEKYSTDAPNPRKRPHRKVSSSAGNDEALDDSKSSAGGGASEPNTPEKAAAPTMQTRHTINHSDIWGRTPPKEPKQACECKICGRFVSTLRFAPHLDKCMGLSTRPATGNPSRNTA